MLDTFGTEQVDPGAAPRGAVGRLRLPPGGDHPRSRPRATDLPGDRRLRPLRAQGVPLGGDRPRRRPPRRRRVAPPTARRTGLDLRRPAAAEPRPIVHLRPRQPSSAPGSARWCRCPSTAARFAAGCSARPTTCRRRMLPVRALVSPTRWFDEGLLELCRWVSERYVAPLAAVLERATPPRVAGEEDAARLAPRRAVGAAPPTAAVLADYRLGDELLAAIAGRAGGAWAAAASARARGQSPSSRRGRRLRRDRPPGARDRAGGVARSRHGAGDRRGVRRSRCRGCSADRSGLGSGRGSTYRPDTTTWSWARARASSRRCPTSARSSSRESPIRPA